MLRQKYKFDSDPLIVSMNDISSRIIKLNCFEEMSGDNFFKAGEIIMQIFSYLHVYSVLLRFSPDAYYTITCSLSCL